MIFRTVFKLIILIQVIMLTALTPMSAQAQGAAATPGSLDTSFNGTGYVTTPSQQNDARALSLAIQPDGKIVTAGSEGDVNHPSVALVTRYLPNGILDLTFGGTGSVRTGLSGLQVYAASVALQNDGKIVVAGAASSEFPVVERLFISRYQADGSLDTTFNGTGIINVTLGSAATSSLDSVAIQPDGKIVAAGYSFTSPAYDFTIVRYNPNGSLDTTFNGTGFAITHLGTADSFALSLALQPDSKIVVAGYARGVSNYDFAVVRYNADGSLDNSFNGTGQVMTPVGNSNDFIRSVAVQVDGKVVAGGHCAGTPTHLCAARFNSNGTLDSSFNGTGKIISPIGSNSEGASVALQGDGKLVVAGTSRQNFRQDFLVVRYNTNGSLDTSFGGTGFVNTPILAGSEARSIAIQTDGKIVVAGIATDSSTAARTSLAVARYTGASTQAAFDYDGDGKADISVFRPTDGGWYMLRSQAGFLGVGFGTATDKIVPADYDGDGKTDVAVYRPSTGVWYILNSSNFSFTYYYFGIAEDLPAPADYDGDGRADLCLFRPSTGTWYRQMSSNGAITAVQFGANGDKPTVGDFDGDGKADLALFRPSAGAWYRLNSSNGAFVPTQFGVSTDLTVPADYDGDGKTDIAVYRAPIGYWYVLNSSNGAFVATNFGAASDIPATGDFDGDGKADLSVFRPTDGAWYRLNSSNGAFFAQQFGANGDLPTPAAFRY